MHTRAIARYLKVAASYNQPGRAALPSQSAQINDIQPYRFFGEQLEVVHPIQVSRMNNTTATIGYVYLRVSLEGVTGDLSTTFSHKLWRFCPIVGDTRCCVEIIPVLRATKHPTL